MADGSGATVPVTRDALRGMGQIMDRAGRAAVAQRAAVARLLELADDLRSDAVQRLRERGASEAQVERYEAAFRSGAAAVRQTGAELDATLGELGRAVQELADV